MRYTLLWIEALGVFALTCLFDMQRKTYTEDELAKKFDGDATLTAWAAFTKANAGKEVIYDMLPS